MGPKQTHFLSRRQVPVDIFLLGLLFSVALTSLTSRHNLFTSPTLKDGVLVTSKAENQARCAAQDVPSWHSWHGPLNVHC
ncbi:hypothetical protein QR680_013067 [Steinernema hermaphroditum]|uniref:Uncharacterized protein n=1 Tax=Steinernema hermaphroditum TaxID=289476 RepID=A0AA39I729_9BILA|nr:hypothetical protein QR680_013067 [Steinernema hermaphroditum]